MSFLPFLIMSVVSFWTSRVLNYHLWILVTRNERSNFCIDAKEGRGIYFSWLFPGWCSFYVSTLRIASCLSSCVQLRFCFMLLAFRVLFQVQVDACTLWVWRHGPLPWFLQPIYAWVLAYQWRQLHLHWSLCTALSFVLLFFQAGGRSGKKTNS